MSKEVYYQCKNCRAKYIYKEDSKKMNCCNKKDVEAIDNMVFKTKKEIKEFERGKDD